MGHVPERAHDDVLAHVAQVIDHEAARLGAVLPPDGQDDPAVRVDGALPCTRHHARMECGLLRWGSRRQES